MNRYAAVDLGASSGRVIAGEVGASVLDVAEVHRFDNEPVHLPDGLHWDVLGLYREVRAGLAKAGPVRSAGIDSWAVDYGLVDADGALLGLPYHYRDERIHKPRKAPTDLYDITGIADLPFNTIHQLLAEPAFRLAAARHVLLIPDLLGYWLTGELGAERTNASTTALYDVRTGDWARELMASVDLPPALFPKLRDPGTVIGPITGSIGGRDGVELVAVASHDTASAVAAVPASSDRFAYISCGTWSLVGVELDAPVLTEASRLATFTNETGVGGTIRYLRNVMGLWLLQECQRAWGGTDVGALLAAAGEAKPFAALVDVNDPVFLPPGDMPSRIAAHCDGQVPDSPGAFTRCVLESLAVGHRLAVHDAMRLSGRTVDTVHIVGGGARNVLLCQLTADACGLPVVAGPVEATALGNLLAQAMAHGTVRDLAQARALVAATQRLEHYEPREPRAWDAAADRVLALR